MPSPAQAHLASTRIRTTAAHFSLRPTLGRTQTTYFSISVTTISQRVTLISANNYQWRTVSFTNALGADAVWLGHQPTQADALAQIDTFDTTKTYYAYTSTDQNVMVLDNSTYVAGSGESRTQEWLSITGDTKERIAKLEGYTPTYWAQTIDEPTLISGDDTETIDAFNVDLLDQFFDSDTRARGRLVFDVRLEKVTNLRIDTTIRVKHGTDYNSHRVGATPKCEHGIHEQFSRGCLGCL